MGTYWAYVGEADFSCGGRKKERRLLLDCEMELQGSTYTVRALVDTGAEVNVIRGGIIPEEDLVTLERPWRLTAANQQSIVGGDKEARVVLCLAGVEVDTKKECGLKIPTTFLVADLGKVDAILSYQWLSDAQLIVNPSRHGVFLTDHKGRGMIWVAGVRADPSPLVIAPPSQESHPLEDEEPQESGVGVLPAVLDSLGDAEIGKGECTMALPPGGFILMRTAPHPTHSLIDNHVVGASEGTSDRQSSLPNQRQHLPSLTDGECPSPGQPGAQDTDTHSQLQNNLITPSITAAGLDPKEGAHGTSPRGLNEGLAAGLPVSGGGGPLHSIDQSKDSHAPNPPLRLLDLYSGYGSVAEVFQAQGYEVVTVDIDPTFRPTIQADMLTWEYWKDFSPGDFDVIACSPPCTEFSQAMTRRPRELEYADSLVLKGLEIIEYLQPNIWFLENPRTGLLPKRPYMKGLAYVDVDYCCFSDWGYRKPTRIWGSRFIGLLANKICDPRVCPSVALREDGVRGHRERLGRTPLPGLRKLQGRHTYRIPANVIRYMMGWPLEEVKRESEELPGNPKGEEPGKPDSCPGPAEAPAALSLPAHQSGGDRQRESTTSGATRPSTTSGASWLSPTSGATRKPTIMSAPDEVHEDLMLGPTATLPGICAIPPPQEKKKKIMRKIETFSCNAEVSSVCSPSTSASEDSEKIPIACSHREDAVASLNLAPTEDFSEKI